MTRAEKEWERQLREMVIDDCDDQEWEQIRNATRFPTLAEMREHSPDIDVALDFNRQLADSRGRGAPRLRPVSLGGKKKAATRKKTGRP
jgi:hypothetical protein